MYSLDRLSDYAHAFRSRLGILPRTRPGLGALEVNYVLSQFGTTMIGSFGVVFLFQLVEGTVMKWILSIGFFFLQRVVVLLCLPIAGWSMARIGYRWVMTLGLASLGLKLWLLSQTTSDRLWLLVPALVLGAVMIACYYLGYHGIFLDDDDERRIGEQIGTLGFLGGAAALSAPLLSGILVARFGFSAMFTVAMAVILGSIVPLLLMSRHRHHQKSYSFHATLSLIRSNGRFSASVFFWHLAEAVGAFFWPIYLFSILGDYATFGAIGSIGFLLNSIVLLQSGKLYDHRPWRRGFPLVALAVAMTWVVRFLSVTPVTVAASDLISRVISPLWWMKIRRFALLAGERTDSLVFGVSWEILVSLGFLAGLMMGLMLVWFGWWWLLVPTTVGIALATWSIIGRVGREESVIIRQ